MSPKRSATRTRTCRCSLPAFPRFICATRSLDGRYRIEKDILTDPSADVVLQRVRFTALQGTLADYRLYALLAPHLNNHGAGNTAWVGDYKGVADAVRRARRLRAGAGVLRAVALAIGRLRRATPTAGSSCEPTDGSSTRYERAENGNVAMTGEIDLRGVGRVRPRARLRRHAGRGRTARGDQPHHGIRRASQGEYIVGVGTMAARDGRRRRGRTPIARPLVDFSAAVLRVHESKSFRGGVIASLSIPWGFNKGDDDLGGYHLVWPRDLVETGGRVPRGRRARRRAARAALPAGHAGRRRPLVPEHVAGRLAVLERHSDGRVGAADPARRSRGAHRRAAGQRSARSTGR